MTLLEALISQGYEKADAKDLIREMRDRVLTDGEDPDEVLYEHGLEPDYVMDLLF